MRRALILLAITMLTANSVGCCCCRGLRDWFYQGAYCGSAPATYAVAPGPAYAAPQQYVAPQYAMPQQYAVAPQAQTMYSEPGCSTPEVSCATPMAYEPGCGYMSGYGESAGSMGGYSESDGVMMNTPTYTMPAPAAE